MTLSIITINLNNRNGLLKTIHSVSSQTYNDMEFIVIDGCSTDGSVNLLKQYSHLISFWYSEKDNGIYDAMNKGLAKATGKYCLFLNSGDILDNRRVLRSIFECHEYDEDLLIGCQKYKDKKGCVHKGWKNSRQEIMDERFLWYGTLPHQATFIKKETLEAIGGYDLNYPISADWIVWNKLLKNNNSSFRLLDIYVSIMEYGGISSNFDRCLIDMSSYLQKTHPIFSKEDWCHLNMMYGFAKLYKRATGSKLSRMLVKLAIQLNKL